jgi:hypothetical protein
MDLQTAERLGKEMVQAVRGYVERALAPIAERLAAAELRLGAMGLLVGRGASAGKLDEVESLIRCVDELKARVRALEARPAGMKYVGVWRGIGYEPGSVCTHDGSMWFCNATTMAKPGTGADWTLCVKSTARR